MKFILTALSLIITSAIALAEGSLDCSLEAQKSRGEIGAFLHFKSQWGSGKIYYWTYNSFDPAKPNLVIIPGGPGLSSRGAISVGKHLTEYNVIYWDQRGIGCSSDFDGFIGSMYSVLDLKEILDTLKIEKVSIYAASYGTVVGTMFASQYPKVVNSLVLEGTLYKGDQWLWTSKDRIKLMQRVFNRLPKELQTSVYEYSGNTQVNASWFAWLSYALMQTENYEEKLKKILNYIFETKNEELILQRISTYSQNPIEKMMEYYKKSNSASLEVFLKTACNELKFDHFESTYSYTITLNKAEKYTFIPFSESQKRNSLCLQYAGPQREIFNFMANEYPVEAPIYYFQGTRDGMTEVSQAHHHYLNVPKNNAYLFFISGSGHQPLFSGFKSQQSKLWLKLFKKTLTPQPITKIDYKDLLDSELNGNIDIKLLKK